MMALGEAITGPVTTAVGSPVYDLSQKTPEYTGKLCFQGPWVPWIGREKTIQYPVVGQPKTFCDALIEGTGSGPAVYARIAATALLAWFAFKSFQGGSK